MRPTSLSSSLAQEITEITPGTVMSRLDRYYAITKPSERSSAAIAFLASLDHIHRSHPLVAQEILQELIDQRSSLKMIASENYSSLAVQLAMGNLMTDKYAEGVAFHRFYAGCDHVDSIEAEAVAEAKKLFGCDHAYVQPHSGADANLVAFWAILVKRVQSKELERLGKKSIDELNPEEYENVRQQLVNQKVLGLSLNSGGHLTHGYRHNISSKFMKALFYEVDPHTEQIDYKKLMEQARLQKPAILLAGYSAHPRRINFAMMREIADAVGATLMVDMAHFAGLVAGKAFKGEYNPIPFADIVTSTTHKTLRGPRGGLILCTDNYKEIVDKGCPLALGGPLPHVIAAKTICFREANTPQFQEYAANIITNAQALAEALHNKGLRLVTGGTENHMVIVDLTSLHITGRHAEGALRQAHITVNRNAIPNDPHGPWYTSGVRIGTPALTTLGMKASQMHEIADMIHACLTHVKPLTQNNGSVSKAQFTLDEPFRVSVEKRAKELLKQFPLYPEIVID